jgi:ribosome maturation factor RimP
LFSGVRVCSASEGVDECRKIWAYGPFFLCSLLILGSFVAGASREELLKLLEPELEALGYELADLEVRLGNGRGLVRLFIDSPEGVGLDDCEKASRQASAILDVEDPIPGDYNLEVSSPGFNRKLVKREHFERFAGSKVKVKLRRLVDGRRNVRGILIGLDGDEVLVKEDEQEVRLPLADVDVARVVPE